MSSKVLILLSALIATANGNSCSTSFCSDKNILLCVFSGQSCIAANNRNGTTGLPTFQDYNLGSKLDVDVIPHLHQAIIPSYRFNCCGEIIAWAVDVQPDGQGIDRMYSLDLQVWRPPPTVGQPAAIAWSATIALLQ